MQEITNVLKQKGMDAQGRTPFEAIPRKLLQQLEEYRDFMYPRSAAAATLGANMLVSEQQETSMLDFLMRYRDPRTV